LAVFIGPYLTVNVVWDTADVFNGLMAFPNLVALILLSPVVARCTTDYFRRLQKGEIPNGTPL
ncbi:MAG: alanine:cation symporter family protein, partial [Kiritimatiellae bacterium]|nr:alanine:cation symporter family protein [Kiritimatiellia bacterium]